MNEPAPHARHEGDGTARRAAEPAPGAVGAHSRNDLRTDLSDAINVRTVGLVCGVLLLQLGFILSYVGAFHSPTPHRIPLGVVAPASAADRVVGQFNAIPSAPVSARSYPDSAAAVRALHAGSLPAALVVDASGTTDRLLVASATGVPLVTAVQQVAQAAEAQQHRTVTVVDVVPVQSGDGRGLSGFYLVIGWIVGGYLVAALLGVAKGARPATPRRAVIRLGAVVPYAIASGLGGALVVDQLLGALRGHFFSLAALGALLVFASAAVTMAFQVVLGVLGVGLTVLVFVVLGNPSAGGAYQPALLPRFWRVLSNALPNGAGTDTVRRIVYFGGHGIGGHLLVIAAYAVGGLAVALVGARRRRGVPAGGAAG